MISVRKQSDTIDVQQPALPSLTVAGGLFALLGGLTLLNGARPPSAWPSTAALFAVAALCMALGQRREVLCRVRRGNGSPGVRGVRGELCVRWSHLDDSRVTVWAEGHELFGGTRITQVLLAADALAQALDVPLAVEPTFSDADPRSVPRPPLAATHGEPWRLARSGALRRAELALWVIGGLSGLQMAALVLSEWDSVPVVHPLSLGLAIFVPVLLLSIALALRSRVPRIQVGDELSVENHFLGHCWQRVVLARAHATCTLLQHPRLDLGFVWIRSESQSLVLSSNSGAAAALTAYLTSRDVPESNRDER